MSDQVSQQQGQQQLGQPEAAAASTPTPPALSHTERHEINLLYHLLRDHLDEIWLSGCRRLGQETYLCDCQIGLSAGCSDEEQSDSDTEDVDDSGGSGGSRGGSSGSSVCGTRFKHQRRSSRWNQEFDEEVREMLGFIDRSYYPTKVYRVK